MKKLLTVVLFVAVPACVSTTPSPKVAGAKPQPDDLVMAVLTASQGSMESSVMGSASTTPTLVAGRATDEFPVNVIPAGLRLLAGSADPSRLVAYAVSGAAPRETRASVEAQMTAAGWNRVVMPGAPGGFVSVSSGTPWCNAERNTAMSISVAARAAGGSFVAWTINRLRGFAGVCALMDPRPAVLPSGISGIQMSQAGITSGIAANAPGVPGIAMMSALPVLTAPAGITLSRLGRSSGSSGAFETSARANGKLGAGDLLQRFSEQLQQVGWKARPAGVSDTGAIQSLELRDGKGKVYAGLLAVTVVGSGDDRDVVFRMIDVSP